MREDLATMKQPRRNNSKKNTYQYAQAELSRHDFNVICEIATRYIRVVAVDSAWDRLLNFKHNRRLFEKRGEVFVRVTLERIAVVEVVKAVVVKKFLEPAQGCFVA